MAAGSLAVKDGNGSGQTLSTFVDAAGNQRSAVSLDSAAQTYRVAASFTPQPTGAVTVLTIKGSASKTVRVKRICIGGVSTANATVPAQVIRTTALGAGGTAVAPTIAKNDSASSAATAVVQHWTTTLKAAGTTAEGPLSSFRLYTSVVTTPTVAPAIIQVFPEAGAQGQSIVLRGVAEFIEVQNTNAGNLSAGTVLDYVVEWEEDNS